MSNMNEADNSHGSDLHFPEGNGIPEVSSGASVEPIQTPASRRFPWFFLVRLTFAIVLVGYLVGRAGPRELWEALRDVNPLLTVEAVVLYAALQMLSAFKWRVILLSQSLGTNESPVPYLRLVAFYFLGMFANLFFPSTIGGDALRAVMVARYAGGVARGALSILMERVTGFLAMITIGLVASVVIMSYPFLSSVDVGDVSFRVGVLLLVTGAAACVMFFGSSIWFRGLASSGQVPRWTPERLHRVLCNLAQCLESFSRNSFLFMVVILISFVFQLLYVVLTELLLLSGGTQVPFLYLCFFSPVLAMVSFLPLTPNGLGVRELTATTLLLSLGVRVHEALLFCVVYYVVTTVASLPGALVWLGWHRELPRAPESRRF